VFAPSIEFRLPTLPLRELVSTCYAVTLPDGAHLEDLLHPEWPNLRFVLTGRWSAPLGTPSATRRTGAPRRMTGASAAQTG
jgi:hypothetical protein